MSNYFSDFHIGTDAHGDLNKQPDGPYIIVKNLIFMGYLSWEKFTFLTFEKSLTFSNFQHHGDEESIC